MESGSITQVLPSQYATVTDTAEAASFLPDFWGVLRGAPFFFEFQGALNGAAENLKKAQEFP